MSRLLILAGTPPMQALEARSYSGYDGCFSLDTSTASSIYNLDQSDPPACAATCGDDFHHVAIQAQFCFCFPAPPEIFTTYNDSDCSINCDLPYQDKSCGGVIPGTLVDVYSYYTGFGGIGQPIRPSAGGSHHISATSSLMLYVEAPSPSEPASTSVEPTITDKPSPATPGPTAQATNEAPSPISTYTTTLWTTVTSVTTIYPGGPLQSTIFSLPTATTCITAEPVFSSSCSEVTVISTCDEDGSMVTGVMPYSPYVSEARELVVEGTGAEASTRAVLAAVVPTETAAAGGLGRRSVDYAPTAGTSAVNNPVKAGVEGGVLTATGSGPSSPWAGTGGLVAASESRGYNVSATLSQFPVTAGASRAGVGWQDGMMLPVILAVVLGASWSWI